MTTTKPSGPMAVGSPMGLCGKVRIARWSSSKRVGFGSSEVVADDRVLVRAANGSEFVPRSRGTADAVQSRTSNIGISLKPKNQSPYGRGEK